LPIANNSLNREFTVQKPDQTWVTDITYIRTDEGRLYLAVMIDSFSRRVVGWQDSDRGSQYCAELFVQMIVQYKLHKSMSRKATCWDNSVAESFFATLKKQVVYANRFKTRVKKGSSYLNTEVASI
jgi:putative transposase